MNDTLMYEAKSNGQQDPGGPIGVLRSAEAKIATGDMLDVRRFEVTARMSELFEVHIVAVSDNPDIDLEAAVGQAMSFTAHGAQARTWAGICSHIQQIAVEENHLSTYEATLVPSLWLATHRRNHRMFQQMSEIEIATALLGEWGVAPSLKLAGTHKKRKYRVQYGETDFTFLSRLLEDAGVSFYFDGECRLVLDDGPHQNGARAPLAFRDNPTHAELEHVTRVRVGRRLRPGKVTVRDVDHRRPPTYKLQASASAGGPEDRMERFHYTPGAFLVEGGQGDDTPHADDKGKYRTDEGEGAALAQRRLDAERGSAREVSFETNALDPSPGVVLSFVDHPKSELAPEKRLLVVSSHFEGEVRGAWRHTCTAVGAETHYRPPSNTARPTVQGVESATVVGRPGEEIHVDEFGRVRVHFHWDRESKMNDASSCWIPVSQPWGGAGFGGTNLPRVGQEVVVGFMGGDPDRPLIVGRIFTNLQKTPYKLPEHKTQSGWKSQSTGAGGGYNELMFEDLSGRELVRMQAEKDLHKTVKHDEEAVVGRDRRRKVGNDEAAEVGRDRTRKVGNDEAVEVGRDRARKVGNDEAVEVGRDRTRKVGNDEAVEVGRDRTRKVGNDETVMVGNSRTRLVGRDESVTIGNDRSHLIANDETVSIGNNHKRHVKNSESVNIGKDLMSMVMQNARETTGLSKNVTVGLHRSTQVGMIDSTTVGESHVVMVLPPGEDGPPGNVTRAHMKKNHYEAGTAGGAALTMDDKKVTLQANMKASAPAPAPKAGAPAPAPKPGAPPAPPAAPPPPKPNSILTIDEQHIELDVSKKATITLTEHKIVFATDDGKGAKITLEGKNITIEAPKGGEIILKGGPMVKVNP